MSVTNNSNSPKKKVLFMLPLLNFGGAERVLVTFMSNIDKSKYEPIFVVLGSHGNVKDWVPDDIEFHSLDKSSVKSSIFAFYKFMRKTKPDIAITTMVHANALLAIMKPLFPKTKFIIRESSTPSALMTDFYGRKGKFCIYVYRYLYPLADLVISPAQSIVDDFKDNLKINMKNHKVLYNPVDEGKISKTLPESFEGDKQILRFVAAGRLNYEKGFDRLIKALGNADMPFNWRLDILGEGPKREELSKLIKDNGLENHVFLRGYQDAPWVIISKSDMFLLSSRWEGMPNVALEALACGTKVIAMKEAGGIVDIAALCPDDVVQVADTIEGFVKKMSMAKAEGKEKPAPSLLPKEFELERVIKNFEGMLDD